MNENEKRTIRFCVRIGHHAVVVEAPSPHEAICEARRLLCVEMPRLWDVIHHLEDSRFEVAPAA